MNEFLQAQLIHYTTLYEQTMQNLANLQVVAKQQEGAIYAIREMIAKAKEQEAKKLEVKP